MKVPDTSSFCAPLPRIASGICLEALLSKASHWVSVQVPDLTQYCWHQPLLGLAVIHFRTYVEVSSAAMVLFSQACSSPPVSREVEGVGAAGP